MTSEHRILVDVTELRALRLCCGHCQAAVSLPLDPNIRVMVPLSCPNCATSWGDLEQGNLRTRLTVALDAIRDLIAVEGYRASGEQYGHLTFAFELKNVSAHLAPPAPR